MQCGTALATSRDVSLAIDEIAAHLEAQLSGAPDWVVLAHDAGVDSDALRAAWEQLTRHPRERVRLALGAHPESRAPIPAPGTGGRDPLVALAESVPRAPAPGDFADPPSVERALLSLLRAQGTALPSVATALAPPLEADPVLVGAHPQESYS